MQEKANGSTKLVQLSSRKRWMWPRLVSLQGKTKGWAYHRKMQAPAWKVYKTNWNKTKKKSAGFSEHTRKNHHQAIDVHQDSHQLLWFLDSCCRGLSPYFCAYKLNGEGKGINTSKSRDEILIRKIYQQWSFKQLGGKHWPYLGVVVVVFSCLSHSFLCNTCYNILLPRSAHVRQSQSLSQFFSGIDRAKSSNMTNQRTIVWPNWM